MDWRTRLTNRYFLTSMISLIGMMILYIIPNFPWEPLEEILLSVLSLLVGIGIVTDPTTPGFFDPEEEETDQTDREF